MIQLWKTALSGTQTIINTLSKVTKIASQMPQPHSLEASEKHNEVVTNVFNGHEMCSVAMATVVRR